MEEASQKSEEPASGVPAYSWYALGVLLLVYMLNFIDRQILSILANDIKADLGLTDANLGFLYGTAFAIFYALFGIPLGRLADQWRRVRLLALGLSLWSLMTALSGFARSALELSAARIGVGVGEATASPCAYSLIADWFPARLRATALAIYSSGLFVGSGLSLLIGGTIVEQWNVAYPLGGPLGLVGWQAAFLAVGLPGMLLALWVLSLREPLRGAIDGIPSIDASAPWWNFWRELACLVPPFTVICALQRGPRALALNLGGAAAIGALSWLLARLTGNVWQFLFLGAGYYSVFSWACAQRERDPPTFRLTWGSLAFLCIVFAYAAVCFVGYSVTYWAAPYAERVFGADKTELGWLLGAPAALGGFLGVIVGGRVADLLQARFASGRVLVIAFGLIAPVPIVLSAYSTQNSTLFYVLSFAVQLATSSALGASAAASQALVLPRMRGTATALLFLGTTLLGLALGPFLAGYVSEATGDLALGVKSTLVAVPLGLAALLLALRQVPAASAALIERARSAGEAF